MTNAPDLSTYLAIHTALRRGAHDLAAAAASLQADDRRRADALGRWWHGYAGEVLAHHTIEDEVFFPALVARVPAAAQLIDRTAEEHEHLDELMTAITAAMAALPSVHVAERTAGLARELAAHMDGHLGFEDDDVVPLFGRHFDAEEYEALDVQARKLLGIGKQAAFTIPFVAASLDGEERDRIFASAPLPFRVLYRLTRRRYARLAAAAFGAPAPAGRQPAAGASIGV